MADCPPPKTHPSYLVNAEAGRAWRRTQEAGPAPHPPPEVAYRLADPQEVPRAASALARAAEKAGWVVAVTYSRGTRLGARGEPLGEPADCIVVRARRGTEWIAAGWVAVHAGRYGFQSGLYLVSGSALMKLSAREITAKVRAPAC